jgi:hypothetical protein
VKIEELEVGERFSFNWCPERTGTVLHVGDSGVMVKEDKSGRTVRIVKKAKWGSGKEDKVCEFEAPGRPMLISGATEVTRIGEESDAA